MNALLKLFQDPSAVDKFTSAVGGPTHAEARRNQLREQGFDDTFSDVSAITDVLSRQRARRIVPGESTTAEDVVRAFQTERDTAEQRTLRSQLMKKLMSLGVVMTWSLPRIPADPEYDPEDEDGYGDAEYAADPETIPPDAAAAADAFGTRMDGQTIIMRHVLDKLRVPSTGPRVDQRLPPKAAPRDALKPAVRARFYTRPDTIAYSFRDPIMPYGGNVDLLNARAPPDPYDPGDDGGSTPCDFACHGAQVMGALHLLRTGGLI